MRRLLVSLVGVILLTPCWATAQTSAPSERPFRGIFGGSNSDAQRTGGLDFNASFQQVYDDDITGRSGTTPGSVVNQPMVGGRSSQAGISLAYSRLSDNFTFNADAQSGGSYYPELPELFELDYSATVAMTVRRGSFQLALLQSAARSPFFTFAFSPMDIEAPLPDADFVRQLQVTRRDGVNLRSGLNVSQQLTKRTALSASASWQQTKDRTNDRTLSNLSGSVHLSQKMTQYLALVGGYGHRVGNYTDDTEYLTQDIMAGVDYDRPLSRTRRTFISFSSGASVLEDNRRARKDYHLNANAGLRRLIGRTWTAVLNFDRSARYVEGFDVPFLTNEFSGSLNGFLSRRIDMTFTAALSKGDVGFSDDASNYDHYYAVVSLRYALTRLTAAQFQYLHYHYKFEEAPAAPTLPQIFDRHGVRAGLRFWLPLVR